MAVPAVRQVAAKLAQKRIRFSPSSACRRVGQGAANGWNRRKCQAHRLVEKIAVRDQRPKTTARQAVSRLAACAVANHHGSWCRARHCDSRCRGIYRRQFPQPDYTPVVPPPAARPNRVSNDRPSNSAREPSPARLTIAQCFRRSPASARVPIERHGDLMLADVKINDQDAQFLLDTGTRDLIISRDVADKLHLPTRHSKNLNTPAGMQTAIRSGKSIRSRSARFGWKKR